jgi:NAD(P)-dependent dehydrogenase (short-subunit alcohol dehydrogenase family)
MSRGRVCLVTGAARRLGRAIALDLAAGGFHVAIHYRSSAAEGAETVRQARDLGVDAHAFPADLSDERACRELAGAVVNHFGRLDAVVNNASTFEADDAHSFSHAAMEMHWRANTAPAVLLARALHEHLVARGATGCVVNLLDQKLWNPNPDYFSYTLSKAALQAATVMLAQALAPVLRVCGVAPGVTLPSADLTGALFTEASRATPLRRGATPDDVAQAVRYLLDANAVTGTTLLVDGGQHLLAQPRDVLHLVQTSRGQTP